MHARQSQGACRGLYQSLGPGPLKGKLLPLLMSAAGVSSDIREF